MYRQASPVEAFLLKKMERITIYVDGFNFYYGLKRQKKIDRDWKKFYWIDFVKFFEHFVGINQILDKVVYFTASPLNIQKSSNQSALLNANKLINGNRFEVVRGKYYAKNIVCPSCQYAIQKPEEKRTDVNVAVRMIGDMVLGKTDIIVLVSADSDLVPPLEFIRDNYPEKKIKIHFPPSNFSFDLSNFTRRGKGKAIRLENNKLRFFNSIMPDTVTDGKESHTIPAKWKIP